MSDRRRSGHTSSLIFVTTEKTEPVKKLTSKNYLTVSLTNQTNQCAKIAIMHFPPIRYDTTRLVLSSTFDDGVCELRKFTEAKNPQSFCHALVPEIQYFQLKT